MSDTVPMYGFGSGGGGGLNFKVVGGTTQPTNYTENTIWVNTSVNIASWAFSATEPASPKEGMVWITAGNSSTVEFNALKKNGIQVYPISAKQYVSGAWVNKTVKSYRGGKFVDWIPEGALYWKGVEAIEWAGSWTKEAEQMTRVGGDSPFYQYSKNKVSFSGHRYIEADLVFTGGSGDVKNSMYIMLMNSIPPDGTVSSGEVALKSIPKGSDGVFTVDVSGVNGSYYVVISSGATVGGGSSNIIRSVKQVK